MGVDDNSWEKVVVAREGYVLYFSAFCASALYAFMLSW